MTNKIINVSPDQHLIRPALRKRAFMMCKSTNQLLKLNGLLNGKSIRFILDTGASSSVLTEKHSIPLEKCIGSLEVANGTISEYSWKTKPVSIILGDNASKLGLIVTRLPEDFDALLGLDWFALTQAIVDPANKRVKFPPKEIFINENDEQLTNIDNDFLLTTIESTGVEEDFDDESIWDLPEHIVDLNTIKHLKEEDQQTVVRLLKLNDDVFASSYGSIGCCKLQPFEILTTTEQPIVIPIESHFMKEN